MAANISAENLTNKKRKVALYTFLEVICVLIICIVGNAFDWVNLKFTWDQIVTWAYWRGVIQKFVMFTCALLVGYFFKMERLELNDQQYFGLLDNYRELLKNKKDSFVNYIETFFNPETKKKFIKARADNKLLKLDKHAKDSWKLEFNKALKIGADLEKYQWSNPKVAKYVKRRIELTKLADMEYINENWEYISIKYPVISPYVFTYGLKDNNVPNAEYRVQNQSAKDLGLVVGRKIILTLLGSILLAMFIMEPSANELLEQVNGWIVLLIKYVMRVVLIAVNFCFGLHSGTEMFENNFILPLQNRIRILCLYLNWCNEHNESSYADQILEAYRKQLELSKQLEQQKAELKEHVKNIENLKQGVANGK